MISQFWIALAAGILVGAVAADLAISGLIKRVLPGYLTGGTWEELRGILDLGPRSAWRLLKKRRGEEE